jgi:hypothetical protein
MKDPTIDLIRKVYSEPVPLQSELSNPFKANKRQRKNVDKSLSEELDSDIQTWEPKDFCKYFANEYKKSIAGFYKLSYVSDGPIFKQILGFMEDNKIDKNLYAKSFIDWCFENKAVIIQSHGFILPNTIIYFLNRYYQEKVYTNNKLEALIDVYDDIEYLDKNGKHKEIYSKFGIPISATYLIRKKKIPLDAVVNLLESIFQKSIYRSPYIPDMELLDWRDVFEEFLIKSKKENWWENNDYPGIPRFDFTKLL